MTQAIGAPRNYMNTEELIESLGVALAANIPVMIYGEPGTGKTSVVRYFFASVAKLPLILAPNVNMSESVDFRGVPANVTRDGMLVTEWSRPNWLPRIDRDGERGGIFLDESNINRALFGSMYQIAEERACGEHGFGRGWLPIFAGNYRTDKALAVDLPSAFNNRVLRVDYKPSPKYFADMIAPQLGFHPMVTAYSRFRPDMLHLMPGQKPEQTHIPAIPSDATQFPTYRMWEKVSDIMKQNPSPAIRPRLIAGLVGDYPAADFESFLLVAGSAMSPADIVANADSAPLPDSIGLSYAVTAALASYATRSNFAAIVRYGRRIAESGMPEFYVTLGIDATRRDSTLKTADGYAQWAGDNAAALA